MTVSFERHGAQVMFLAVELNLWKNFSISKRCREIDCNALHMGTGVLTRRKCILAEAVLNRAVISVGVLLSGIWQFVTEL